MISRRQFVVTGIQGLGAWLVGPGVNGGSVFVCLDDKLDRQRARYLLKALKNYIMEKTP